MPRRKYTLLYYIAVFLVLLLASCDENTVYNHFEHLSLRGWEKNDTISFSIPRITEAGYYKEELGLRINEDYPFLGLCLIIQQTVLPSGYCHNYTCDIAQL